jgi:hypothetical protein
VNYNTAEYQRSNAAVAANALSAYNAGATGKGIKVAVIDSGISTTNTEFAGKIDPASRDVAGTRPLGDEDGHGTAVSAVAAAAKDDINIQGVAFDATIVAMKADQPGSCADTSGNGCTFYDPAIAAGIDAARLAGAKVINMSLGGSTPSSQLMSAISRAVNAGIIVVISAGNDGEKPEGVNPDPFALIPAQTYPGQVIIAGSVGVASGTGTDINQLSTFSNRAGTGANFYLAALGYRVRAPGADGQTYAWSGTSFSAPAISGAVALLAQAFPNLTARQIVDILFTTADDLGAIGTDSIYGRGRMNLDRAFKPIGQTSLAGQEVLVTGGSDLPPAAGDGGGAKLPGSFGAVILDGYDRAFAIDFAKTLRAAPAERPLAQALQGNVKYAGGAAGPVSIAMTVSQDRDRQLGYAIDRLGIGPEDARAARLIAGSAVAQLDRNTAAAFGLREGAKALERRLTGAQAGAFLIAKDITANPGFAVSRGAGMALRRQVGEFGLTVSSETGNVWNDIRASATGLPYQWNGVSIDRNLGSNWLSAGIGRLEEKGTVLGGRVSDALGGGGSSTLFFDVEARRTLGSGFSAGLTARRGWTDFTGGKFATSAYGFDLTKSGILSSSDRLGLRLSQPLRVESGGFNLLLPTSWNYETQTATNSWQRYSMSPSGREIDGEFSYSSSILNGSGWLGGNLFLRKDPGHVAGADPDYGAAIRFSLNF